MRVSKFFLESMLINKRSSAISQLHERLPIPVRGAIWLLETNETTFVYIYFFSSIEYQSKEKQVITFLI